MAFPQIAATNSGNSGANLTTHTVNLPESIQANDILLVGWYNDAGSVTATITTPPSGWNVLINATIFGLRLVVWWRRADGSEGSTITVTTSGSEASAHWSYRISGAHLTSDPEVTPTAATATSIAPNSGSFSPSWGAEDTLFLSAIAWDGDYSVSSWPSDYTLSRTTNRYAIGTGGGVAVAGRELAAASDDPAAYGMSNTSVVWQAVTIAIRPGGPTGNPWYYYAQQQAVAL